jgi:hypothetical protein
MENDKIQIISKDEESNEDEETNLSTEEKEVLAKQKMKESKFQEAANLFSDILETK